MFRRLADSTETTIAFTFFASISLLAAYVELLAITNPPP